MDQMKESETTLCFLESKKGVKNLGAFANDEADELRKRISIFA